MVCRQRLALSRLLALAGQPSYRIWLLIVLQLQGSTAAIPGCFYLEAPIIMTANGIDIPFSSTALHGGPSKKAGHLIIINTELSQERLAFFMQAQKFC